MICSTLLKTRPIRQNVRLYHNRLNQLHQELYNEVHDFGTIDTKPYLETVKKIFHANPVFNKLSEKYQLSDLSLDNDKIITMDMVEKYIYIYIYLELLYEKIRNNKEEKDKLYDRINHTGPDNNLFGYIKLYTVYGSTKFTKMFKSPVCLRFFSSMFLMFNIIEAVIEDTVKFQFTNAFVGLYLALSVPFIVRNFRKDLHENILCDFDKKWINLYTSWNVRFTYSGSPGKNYFPRTSVCLLNSYHHRVEWLNNRAYVLFASHTLKTFKIFNEDFGLEDKPNQQLLRDWDKANVAYMLGLL